MHKKVYTNRLPRNHCLGLLAFHYTVSLTIKTIFEWPPHPHLPTPDVNINVDNDIDFPQLKLDDDSEETWDGCYKTFFCLKGLANELPSGIGGCHPGFDGQIKKSKFWKRNEKQKTKLTFFGTNDSDDFYGIGLVQICI